jgi:pimeloyl-ACP methyl ester carboxylesterase
MRKVVLRLCLTNVVVALSIAAAAAGCTSSHAAAQGSDGMQTITSNDGTRIAYWRGGSGPPMVLVHGTTADHTRWARVLPDLERHYTVYAVDRRGRGGSGDAAAYSLEREFEDVAAVVNSIREPVVLLGHSYGAICSLEAARLTRNVRALILYEPPLPLGGPVYPRGVAERVRALVDRGELEAALETFFKEVVRMPDHELARFRALPVWSVRVKLAPTIPRELELDRGYRFQPDRFAALRIPTLLLLGGDSPPLFREAVAAVQAAVPGSRIVILQGQQHAAMDMAPQLFVDEVLKFLARDGAE